MVLRRTAAVRLHYKVFLHAQWIYGGTGRAMGSMYAGEKTPDGYTVDDNGAWTGK